MLDEAKLDHHSGAVSTRAADFNWKFELIDAHARRQQRIRFLRLGEEQHRRLADKLSSCERNHRCKSEADPVCVTLFGEKVRQAVVRFCLRGRGRWRGSSPPTYGHLNEFDLAEAVERLRKRIARATLDNRIVIGAIDFTLKWPKLKGQPRGPEVVRNDYSDNDSFQAGERSIEVTCKGRAIKP